MPKPNITGNPMLTEEDLARFVEERMAGLRLTASHVAHFKSLRVRRDEVAGQTLEAIEERLMARRVEGDPDYDLNFSVASKVAGPLHQQINCQFTITLINWNGYEDFRETVEVGSMAELVPLVQRFLDVGAVAGYCADGTLAPLEAKMCRCVGTPCRLRRRQGGRIVAASRMLSS